jgi:hypothetical protein
MYGRKESSLMKYEPGTLDLRQIKMPPALASAARIRIANGKIYALTGGILRAYTIRN